MTIAGRKKMSTNPLTVVGKETEIISPSQLVANLAPKDKATIMSLCMPKNSNDSELSMYLYRCKEQGFDPLSGELVLQKWVNSDGSIKLSFITTRDALLKKAELNPNYMGLNSGTVREGDTFLVDTEKGIVKHTFGIKRGKLLAGWAVVYHKTRLPMIAVSDFDEYAFSCAKSPVWKALPSVMIQKVAEVAALRRQFPIMVQGIYTAEEMQPGIDPVPVGEPVPEKNISSPRVVEIVDAEKVEEVSEVKQEQTPVSASTPEQTTQAPKETTVVQEIPMEIVPEANPQVQDAYKLLILQTGKSGTGTPYAKIACEKGDQKYVLLAKGEEGVAEAGKLSEGCMFLAETIEDMGFIFVQKITVI